MAFYGERHGLICFPGAIPSQNYRIEHCMIDPIVNAHPGMSSLDILGRIITISVSDSSSKSELTGELHESISTGCGFVEQVVVHTVDPTSSSCTGHPINAHLTGGTRLLKHACRSISAGELIGRPLYWIFNDTPADDTNLSKEHPR